MSIEYYSKLINNKGSARLQMYWTHNNNLTEGKKIIIIKKYNN